MLSLSYQLVYFHKIFFTFSVRFPFARIDFDFMIYVGKVSDKTFIKVIRDITITITLCKSVCFITSNDPQLDTELLIFPLLLTRSPTIP